MDSFFSASIGLHLSIDTKIRFGSLSPERWRPLSRRGASMERQTHRLSLVCYLGGKNLASMSKQDRHLVVGFIGEVFARVGEDALGQSVLTFGLEFHMYTCMYAFTRRIASPHTVKVDHVTAKHCATIAQRQAPE